VTEISSAVAELQTRWPNLSDLDRAQAVLSIQQEGMSLRGLAPHLRCSPSLLSYLLRVAQAPAEDRARARRGEISTRALARIVGTFGTRGTVHEREAVAFERERAAFHASKSVLKWLEGEECKDADKTPIVEQARLLLVEGQGWKQAFLEGRLDDVVRESRIAQTETRKVRSLSWFALRLALWSLRTIPDDQLRDRALEVATGVLSNS